MIFSSTEMRKVSRPSNASAFALTAEVKGEIRERSAREVKMMTLTKLIDRADVERPETLNALARELAAQGYGFETAMPIHPVVMSKVSEGVWAFLWQLDRDCETLNWLRGREVVVEGERYVVRTFENARRGYRIGEKVTLICVPRTAA